MKRTRINILLVFGVAALLSVSCQSGASRYWEKSVWIENAFKVLEDGRYPRVKAISWWHEDFDSSRLRIDSSSSSLASYRNGVSSALFITSPVFQDGKLVSPSGGMYHSAYPDFGGTEDTVTAGRIESFEDLAGKEIVWAYFSNNWKDKIEFPADSVAVIHDAGKIPFIRLMARSGFDEGGPDKKYTMANILAGDFDSELEQWADNAKDTGINLLAEFGTEVNGSWFPWNGLYNGGNVKDGYGDPQVPDGPERFRDAYRHIIDICNNRGADNITWFFHADAYSEPDEPWNSIANYYPGDDYIDWIGVSVYGPQEDGEDYQEFSEIMDDVYPELTSLSAVKPIAVLEFAVTE